MGRRLMHAAVVIVALFAVAQLIRPDRTNPPTDISRTIQAQVGTASGLAAVLDRSCRDCHSNNILEARTKLFKDYADNHFMTVYGEPFQPLLDLLQAHAGGFKWFSFLQGLGPSPVNPSRIPGATREATQPV